VIFPKDEKSSLELVYELLKGLLVLPVHVIVVTDAEPADHVKHPYRKITWLNPESGRNAQKLTNG